MAEGEYGLHVTVPVLSPLEMTVEAGDRLVLKGVLEYPATPRPDRGYPLAVLAHQYPSTGDSYTPLVEDLLDLGAAVLVFDERGHGSSTMTPSGPLVIDSPNGFGLEAFGKAFVSSISKVGFHRIDDDIIRVAGWGAAQNFIDPGRLVLVGASVGGSGAVLASPRVSGLLGVLTFGAAGAPAFGDDGPDRCRKAVQECGAPVLLTSSEEDPFDGAANARSWSQGEKAEAKLTPGDDHAMAIYYDVRDDVIRFLKHLLS